MVLAISVTREDAAQLVEPYISEPTNIWPSSLYRIAARVALQSPLLWRRCEEYLDRRLGISAPSTGEYGYSVEAFHRNREHMTWTQIAGFLWGLVKKNSPLLYPPSPILEEVALLALNRLPGAAGTHAQRLASQPNESMRSMVEAV